MIEDGSIAVSEVSDSDGSVAVEALCEEGFQLGQVVMCKADVDSSGKVVVSTPIPICVAPGRCGTLCYILIAVGVVAGLLFFLLLLCLIIVYCKRKEGRYYKPPKEGLSDVILTPKRGGFVPAKESK